MPTVPRKTGQAVAPGRIPETRTRSGVPIEAFGGGRRLDRQSAIARETLGLAFKISESERKELEETKRKAKEDMDKMLFLDADLQAAELQNNLDLKVRDMKGRDAAGAMEFINDGWEKGTEEISSTLFNQDQKNAFSMAAQKRFLSLSKGTAIHMDVQFDKYSEGLRKSSMKVSQEQAAINYTDPEFVAEQFDKQAALISSFAEQEGKGKEWEENEIAKSRSRTHSEIITRMMFDGQIELATEYEKSVKDEIRNDDLASIRRLRTEEKRLRRSNNDNFHRTLWKRESEDDLSNEQVDDMFFSGQINKPLWSQLKTAINKNYDDDAISDENKTTKYFEALDRYAKLSGASVDKTNKIVKRAKDAQLDELQEFRDWMGENKGFFTRPQYRELINFTEQNYTEAREGKLGMWASLRQKLEGLTNNRQLMALALSRAFGPMFNPAATPVQAQQIADETVEAAVVNANPNRTQYKIGQILNLPTGSWEVKGFYEDGEPDIELLEESR